MGLNKVIDRVGTVLLDLSADTATPRDVVAGKTFHDAKGELRMGTATAAELQPSNYNFIDYDGVLVYSYTDEELDALEALPAGPDHTDDNLTFQEWNWTLDELKSWNREREDRPVVGANYITTDGKSYLFLDLPSGNRTLSFSKSGTLNSVDWGDGTIDTNTSHTYANPGTYTVVIDLTGSGSYWYVGTSTPGASTAKQYIKNVRLGNFTSLDGYAFYYCSSLETISIPASVWVRNSSSIFHNCRSLKSIVVPRGVNNDNENIPSYTFSYNYKLETVSFPPTITSFSSYVFERNYHLKNVVLPENITNIPGYMFQKCTNLGYLVIPSNVRTLGSSTFAECYNLTKLTIPDSVTDIYSMCFNGTDSPLILDLSKQTKVIPITASPSLTVTYGAKILVPNDLLAAYKSASYWSSYAAVMVGV